MVHWSHTCQVEWQPYHDMDEIVPEDIKDTLILGRSRTTLICLDKAEKHLPDRCVRQFGFNQPIPQEVPQWKGIDGEADQSKSIASSCEDWSKHRDQIVEGDDRVDDSEYLLWYSNITRKFVGRHTSLESMFRQTVTPLIPFFLTPCVGICEGNEIYNVQPSLSFFFLRLLAWQKCWS